MKKIAADRNYRMLKRAGEYGQVADHRSMVLADLSKKFPKCDDAAFIIYQAISMMAMVDGGGLDCGHGGKDQDNPKCRGPEKELLAFTEDAMTGMKHYYWSKYEKPLYARIKDVNPSEAACIIGNIFVNKESLD
mgnify:CR=1 FL=1|tara:strand:+ start:864 stop:1265 length:402 start_codon:yes stop_codon:yes gene_type:complete